MYAYIRGIVDEVALDRAVIEAGGVGYELFCSSMTLKKLQPGYGSLFLRESVSRLIRPEETVGLVFW